MVRVGPYTKSGVVPAFHVVTGERPEEKLVARRYRMCRRGSLAYPLDDLLGDDEYIFLSVAGLAGDTSPLATCYVFDAETLIRSGALLRIGDVLATPEYGTFDDRIRALTGAMGRYTRPVSAHELSRDDLLELIGTHESVSAAFERLKAARDRITLSGEVALRKLGSCAGCEILVPRELPLAGAIGRGTRSEIYEEYSRLEVR